jgi:ribosomal protein L37E
MKILSKSDPKKRGFPKKCPACNGMVIYNIQKAKCMSCGWGKNLQE